MKVEFTGQSARDADNIQANPSRLVNCYREVVQSGGKSGHVLKSVPGLASFAAVAGVFVRCLEEVGGDLYTSCNGAFVKIASSGAVTILGSVTDGENATVAGNNGSIGLVIGGAYRVWDGATLLTPTPGQFSAFGSVDYIGSYSVLTQLGGNEFCWSDVAAPQTLPALNFTSADGRDDKIIRGMAISGQYVVFKEKSHEIWYVTGDSGAKAFDRQAGGVIDVGLMAFNLLCRVPGGGAFYVGSDGKVRVIGLQSPVSIPPVETAIATKIPEFCIAYEDEGHTFCAITFSDAPAWVYDLSSGEWHERAQGAELGPWKASVSAKMAGVWYAGRDGGEILSFGRTNSDGGLPLVRRAVSRTIAPGKRFVLSEVEVFPRIGFDPGTVELTVSKDGGHTWGAPKARSWSVGEYGKRINWRALGQFRNAVLQIQISDPIECPINAEGNVNAA